MEYLLLYTREDDIINAPWSGFLLALDSRRVASHFSVEANTVVAKYKHFSRIRVSDVDINLILKSTRGKPIRRLPALLRLDKDTDNLSIVTAVLYADDIMADDLDILIQ